MVPLTAGRHMDGTHLFELVIAIFLAIIALHYLAHRLGLPPSVALLAGGADGEDYGVAFD